jgi:ribonuclease HI
LATAAIADANNQFSPHQQQQAASVILYAAKRNQVTNHEGGSSLSRTDIRRMRVADLRDELGRRGLSSSGLREALVARLLDASSPSTRENSILDGITSIRPTRRPSSNTSNRSKMSAAAVANNKGETEAKKESKSSTGTVTSQLSPEKTYVLRFDGGSRGNPGISGSGMVLYDADEGTEVWSGFHYLGDSHTNNEAEYTGVVEGLRCAHAMGARAIVIQGDSQLIIRQLEGKYGVKSEKLRPYYQQVQKLLRQFDSFHLCHIEREENARADELANKAMNTRRSSLDM